MRSLFVPLNLGDPARSDQLFLYRVRDSHSVQHGILGGLSSQARNSSLIMPHERTLPNKLSLFRANHFRLEDRIPPIHLVFPDHYNIAKIIRELILDLSPVFSTKKGESIHEVFEVGDEDNRLLHDVISSLDKCLIADGHHRFTTWTLHPDAAPAQLPSYLVSSREVQIKSFSRLISGLNGYSRDGLAAKVAEIFEPIDFGADTLVRTVRLCIEGCWYRYQMSPYPVYLPMQSADVPIAEYNADHVEFFAELVDSKIIHEILGVELPQDHRVRFIEGNLSLSDIASLASKNSVAVVVDPPAIDDLFQMASRSQCMPPHSTWFGLKPDQDVITELINIFKCIAISRQS